MYLGAEANWAKSVLEGGKDSFNSQLQKDADAPAKLLGLWGIFPAGPTPTFCRGSLFCVFRFIVNQSPMLVSFDNGASS
jgi:hypothetical protein